MAKMNQENQSHGFAIKRVLYGINSSQGNPFVLKGGTALMECYGLIGLRVTPQLTVTMV